MTEGVYGGARTLSDVRTEGRRRGGDATAAPLPDGVPVPVVAAPVDGSVVDVAGGTVVGGAVVGGDDVVVAGGVEADGVAAGGVAAGGEVVGGEVVGAVDDGAVVVEVGVPAAGWDLAAVSEGWCSTVGRVRFALGGFV